MKFSGMEDRLNPIPKEGIDESTLGGYPAVHGRAPGFDASDGFPYTVAVVVEPPGPGSDGTYGAYLVFVRWASSGGAIMGHLETDDLATGASEEEARRVIEALPLRRVKEILEETIARKRAEGEKG